MKRVYDDGEESATMQAGAAGFAVAVFSDGSKVHTEMPNALVEFSGAEYRAGQEDALQAKARAKAKANKTKAKGKAKAKAKASGEEVENVAMKASGEELENVVMKWQVCYYKTKARIGIKRAFGVRPTPQVFSFSKPTATEAEHREIAKKVLAHMDELATKGEGLQAESVEKDGKKFALSLCS